MADLSYVFLVVVIVLDFVFSLWNAYASGLTWTLLRGQPGQRFAKAAAIAGLGLAFAGMAYAMLLTLSFAGLFLGLLAAADVLFVVSFDFLVFGAMIIGFGLVVTAQSIAIAYRERNFGAIAVAAWNVFAEVWDVAIYAEGFKDAAAVVSTDRDRVNLYAFIAVAVGIAFLITYVAFRHGARAADRVIADSPATAGAPPSAGAPPGRRLRPRTTILIVAVAIVVVVVALIALRPLVTPAVSVKVTGINVWAPNNVCGLRSNPIGYSGFTDAPSASDAFALEVPNFNSTPCTIHSVTTNTSGFGLANVQVPLTVLGGQNGSLNLTVVLASGAYQGALDLVYA